MEIQWLGHACFKISHRGYSIVIDPYDSDYTSGYPKLRVKADKLLVSHEHYGHNYRQGVLLSGRPERDCPFSISTMETWHDSVCGIMRGKTLIHILEAEGMKLAHMGDSGTQVSGGERSRLFGADALMVTAGSCTGLPAQEVWRMTEELFPKVIIPMHYRDGKRGPRRLEHIEALTNYFEAPEMIHHYPGDSITITPDMEPQVAVLKYMGG